MAYKTSPSFISPLLLSVMVFAIVTEAVAARHIDHKNPKDVDKKQPEFFLGGGFPGIDKLKHKFDLLPHLPTTGFLPPTTGSFPSPSTGSSGGAGGAGHSYVPGADDNPIPNPGFEVPYPGGGTPATPHPLNFESYFAMHLGT